MFGTNDREKNGGKQCAAVESQLVEYLDGRARPAERHAVEEHLAGCATCNARAIEFRALWGALDELPEIVPSREFDASVRARIAAEPVRQGFWDWLPSPRFAFAITALVIFSVWLSSAPHGVKAPVELNQTAQVNKVSPEKDFGMIQNLPELENYDVISKFDALSELPVANAASNEDLKKETR
ncbi:MAG TPA: zf-HC2 domain-containing protein [Candidatus Acidoferrales bacterium]|nr:zf-HC2 domain-containing protein [Candidatus Acidoferrales bacterium]